jgi:hypothetical protein
MPRIRGNLTTFAAVAILFAIGLHAQDEQSLGDVARQSRLQKQQKSSGSAKAVAGSAKDNPPKPGDAPKAKRVITNEEIPEHIGPTRTLPAKQTTAGYTPPSNYDGTPPPEYWKTQIQAQKNNLVSLQNQISELANSIQFAGGSCVSNCVQWNEQQLRKQGQLESMKAQLEQQQKSLEEMQDAARRQGFGSAVYDP